MTITTPLEVTTTAVPDPASAVRGETDYVILELDTSEEETRELHREAGAFVEEEPETWVKVGEESAKSGPAAVRSYADRIGAERAGGKTFVAVPTRSWKPMRGRTQVVTTMIWEEEAS